MAGTQLVDREWGHLKDMLPDGLSARTEEDRARYAEYIYICVYIYIYIYILGRRSGNGFYTPATGGSGSAWRPGTTCKQIPELWCRPIPPRICPDGTTGREGDDWSFR